MGKSVVKVVNPCVCSTYYGKANAYAKIEYENGEIKSIYSEQNEGLQTVTK